MTNQQPSEQDNGNSESLSWKERVWAAAKKPRNQIIAVVGLGAIAVGSYIGGRVIINNVIPAQIENQLERILARDVTLGKVSFDSWNRILVDDVLIHTTDQDDSYLQIDTLKIDADFSPLLSQRKVFVDAVANGITGYAQLDTMFPPKEDDTPVPKSLLIRPLPFVTPEIDLAIQNANVSVAANANTKAIVAQPQGDIKFIYDAEIQPVSYQLDIKLNKNDNALKLTGETLLSNTASNNQLQVNNVDLPEAFPVLSWIFPFLAQLPVDLETGVIQGQINAEIPSFREIQDTNLAGGLTFTNVTGKVAQKIIAQNKNLATIPLLKQDFIANADVNLEQQSIKIADADLDWGDLQGTATGEANLKTGYDLQAKLNSFEVAKLLPQLGVTSPVAVSGLANSNVKVTGKLNDPTISGNLQVRESLVDKALLGTINSSFVANLDQIKVNQVKINPTFGGEIRSQALIKTNLRNTKADEPWQLNKVDLNLKFLANLPSNPYIDFDRLAQNTIQFGNLVAVGEVKGKLANPQGFVNFSFPNMRSDQIKNLKTQGKIVLNQQKIEIVDTQVVADNSRIQVKGGSDLKKKTWQVNVTGKDFNLTPFVAQFCQYNSACASAPVNLNQPIVLNNLNSNFQGKLSPDLTQIRGQGKLNLRIDNGNLDLNTNISNGNLALDGNATNLDLDQLLLTLPETRIVNSKIELSTNIQELTTIADNRNLPASFKLNTTSQLEVEQGTIDAIARIDSKQTNILADISQIPISEIIPSLPAQLSSGEIKLNARTQELYQFATQSANYDRLLALDSLQLQANLDGTLANGRFNSVAKVNRGVVSVVGNAQDVSPSQVLPNLNLPSSNLDGNFTLDGKLSEFVNVGVNYLQKQPLTPPPSLRVNARGDIDVAEGKVLVNAQLRENRWQSQIESNDINLENLTQQIPAVQKNNLNLASLPTLDSDINLRGNINSLAQKNASLPIEVQPTSLTLGKNKVNVEGRLNLVNVFEQPDIDDLRLQVAAESQLDSIETREILASVNDEGINIIPQEIDLQGQAKFNGVLVGNNLITNPSGKDSINLQGDVTLKQFQANDVKFEPTLTGKLFANPQTTISLDLRGKRDVIGAKVSRRDLPIPTTNVTLPYTPDKLEIRQGGADGFSLASNREGNNFITSINNLPLDSLEVQPVANYGIKGKIKGNLASEIDLNLDNFTAQGNVKITQPGLDFIEAKEISSSFAFRDNVASLNDGVIKFGRTTYNLAGKYNLKTQDIEGKVDLKGDVEDIFNTLKITDIETLTAFAKQLSTGDYFAEASEIPSQTIAPANDNIKSQINLLAVVDEQIKAIAQQVRAGKIPNDLDLQGRYRGEIVLGGKLTNPQVNLDFKGQRWQWLPQREFPNIVESLGFVMEQTEAIPIPRVDVNAAFRNQTLTIEPLLINIAGSRIAFNGDISPQSQTGEFDIRRFPLDLITRFLPLTVDVESSIDLAGTIKGRFINPEVEGVLTLNNTAIDSTIIEEKITSNFTYNNYELNLQTTSPEYIALDAQVPYFPLAENNKPVIISLELGKEIADVFGLVSEGKIQVTDGDFASQIDVRIDSMDQLIEDFDLEDIQISGSINFEQTELRSIFLNEAVYVTGQVNLLENQVINVDNLVAKLNDTNINIEGDLPILNPNRTENTLAINIPEQSLNLENLYSGNLDANILIDGSVLNPNIGGYLALKDGFFTLPSRQTITDTRNQVLWNRWLGDSLNTTVKSLIQPNLTNFTLELDNSQLVQWGLYRFLFAGQLDINGPVLDFDRLRADGEINIRRGQIYLGGATAFTNVASGLSGSSTTFYLSRTNENKISFAPDESILNPDLDIQVNADIVDYSRKLPSTQRNEVSDPVIRGGRGENIQVTLDIEGGLAQLLPVLSGNVNRSCVFPIEDRFAESVSVPSEKLDLVETCVNLAILNPNLSGANNILSSPLVSLSSIPNRSEGELINLIVGGQLLNLATQLQNFTTEDLLENGLIQFLLVPLVNNASFGVNETVSTWGQPLGMDDLRVFPLVEGVYQVQEQASVSVSYDYFFSEFKVQYQMRF